MVRSDGLHEGHGETRWGVGQMEGMMSDCMEGITKRSKVVRYDFNESDNTTHGGQNERDVDVVRYGGMMACKEGRAKRGSEVVRYVGSLHGWQGELGGEV